jgi:excisionase family DNA binding protein
MQDTDTYPEWLRIGEVAKAFGVTVPTIRAWERAGRINATRTLGGQRQFLKAEVDALRGRTVGTR